ncbi:unnamed protein product [Arabidopsis halleri]
MAEEDVTADVRVPSHRYDRRCIMEGEVDIISSLPDVILQHILCFTPTELAIRTSLLSKRWRVLDLRECLRLRRLQVVRNFWGTDPLKIVAPQIHRLILRNSQFPCNLVDVSSLSEAKVNICFDSKADFLQFMTMLEKFQNVETLNIGGDFLQLSFAELRGDPFPIFNVKALTIETTIFQFVIPPGIERLLQNSPDLKKLTIHTRTCYTMLGKRIDSSHLDSLDSDSDPDQCMQSKDRIFRNKSRWDVESKHLASFMELMLKNTKRLEKMIVLLEDRYLKARGFKSLTRTLSRNSDVYIVFSTKPTRSDEWGIIGFNFD